MKLSKKGEYALRALIDLGIAGEVGRGLVQVSELAENEQIPMKFLEQIMQQLKEARLIESQRGKYGGYRLALPAKDIRIGQVVRLIDGPLAPIGCVSQTAYERCSCPDEDHCGLRMLMLDVRNAIAGILDRYSLADVVEVTTRRMKRDGIPLPYSTGRRVRSTSPSASVPSAAVTRGRTPDPLEGILSNLMPDYTI